MQSSFCSRAMRRRTFWACFGGWALDAMDVQIYSFVIPTLIIVFAISPGFRFFYRWVEPGVSLLLPVGAPLLGAVDNYVALRVDLRVWFGR